MSRFAYVSGKYIPFHHATTHIEDRGYQFGDGVYEAIAVLFGKRVDAQEHLDRLVRSLAFLHIPLPLPLSAFEGIFDELMDLNRIQNGYFYIQVTRGIAPRFHAFPPQKIPPRLTITLRRMNHTSHTHEKNKGVLVITQEDPRWNRVDIKTINLLPAVLAKQEAIERGVFETVWVKDGVVREGSSSNIFAIIDGVLRTHPPAHAILDGITKNRILTFCKILSIPVEEKAFTVEELYTAQEAFLTGANNMVIPIKQVDGRMIKGEMPGHITHMLQRAYFDFAKNEV